ncbi:hypothetical protein IWW50_000629 [Coemansia erecta]|nr:hypothetical protein IWW50_000629 [Coemansia erecta]
MLRSIANTALKGAYRRYTHVQVSAQPILRQYSSDAASISIKRRPLPTTTSKEYTIPQDPYLLAKKFQQVVRGGNLDDAVAIVMQSKTRDQSPVVWNLVIEEYARRGRLSRALRAYTEMRRRGFTPTQTTYTAVLKACALGDSEKAVAIAEHTYASMSSSGVAPSIINMNSLLSVYQRKHDIERALQRFNDLPSSGAMAPSLATYTILVSMCRRQITMLYEEQARLKPVDEHGAKVVLDIEQRTYNSQRIAAAKNDIRSTFATVMQLWDMYTADAEQRLREPAEDTHALAYDTRILKLVLKACHALYEDERELARKGFNIIARVYGGSRRVDAHGEVSFALPLAARLRRTKDMGVDREAASQHPILDKDVIDLAIGLCDRGKRYSNIVRLWSSLEKYFPAELEPLQAQFAAEIAEFTVLASAPPDARRGKSAKLTLFRTRRLSAKNNNNAQKKEEGETK